ncbi:MAG: GNAT family N-acetyltransferase [Oligoflexus sp.]|jgi:RimJ/RimL family protein N-acetyltransferase
MVVMNDETFELQCWAEIHRESFVEMQRDADVMADLGGVFDREASDAKFDRYRDAWLLHGISRWAVVSARGQFLGYTGVMRRTDLDHPLGSHYEIGWRFCRSAWGKGLATRSALQALHHAWTVLETHEILSYTAANNLRSQNVMSRLGLKRDEARDFTAMYPKGQWSGLVWVAGRPSS